MRWICAGLIALATVARAGDDDLKLSIAALRLGVPDLGAAADFYARHLGFTMAMDERASGFIVLMNGPAYLVLSQASAPVTLTDTACHIRFNFAAADLDAAAASMKEAGVEFLAEGRSAVGRYLTFVDPAGHRHNLKALDDDAGEGPPIRVYNAGVAVSDMAAARAFYEKTLGFTPLTEDYYPPVIPYQPGGCTFFILSDRGATAPAPYVPGGAWAGLALEATDIASAYETLKARGVVFAHEPRPSGPVLHAPFTDPFGNTLELIQHVAPAPPQAQPDAAPAQAIEDLAFIAGDGARMRCGDAPHARGEQTAAPMWS